jgi:hypothetical protein
MTKTAPITAEQARQNAYLRTMRALNAVKDLIHDQPAPEGEIEIHWGHVGDMNRIAAALEELVGGR